MLKDYISELNERLLLGKEVIFPVPREGLMGLLEAGLLRCRKGSLLPYCERRLIVIGLSAYHVYKL